MTKEMDQGGLMTVAMVMCFCDRACDFGEKASCRVVVFHCFNDVVVLLVNALR